MKIEFNLSSLYDILFGISISQGEDEDGIFIVYSIGFLLFSIDIYAY